MSTVLHLIPSLGGGGAERQLAMLASEQSVRGWTIHIAVRREGVHLERLERAGVTVHRLGDYPGAHPLLAIRIGALVRRVRPRLVQTWLPQMDVVGGAVALGLSVPWVLTERTSEDAYRDMVTLAWTRLRLGRHAAAVVANSVEGSRYWDRVLPRGHKLFTVPNAVDLQEVRDAAPLPCGPLAPGDSAFLSVGRLAVEKSPEVLIQALQRLPPSAKTRCLFLGDGPLEDTLVATVAAKGLGERVTLLPYEPRWWGRLKTAAALVSTSRFEGQPNVVLEAMAGGCPLIVTDIPAHRAILDDSSALFVPVDDAGALAGAVLASLTDPVAASRRAAQALQRCRAHSIVAAVDAYERVYAQVLGEAG